MQIIYGEDYLSSRNYLNKLLESSNSTRVEAKDLEVGVLKQYLGNNDLFGEIPTVVIYGLLSSLASKKKDQLIKVILGESPASLILYEDKDVNATSLKKFTKATLKKFDIPPIIFQFMDNLKPNQAVNLPDLDPHFIFSMLVRQIRLLLSAGPNSSMPPWMAKKLLTQKNLFGEERLLKMQQDLYLIDKRQKTSTSFLSMDEELKNFFILI
jgi:hypothetical protein